MDAITGHEPTVKRGVGRPRKKEPCPLVSGQGGKVLARLCRTASGLVAELNSLIAPKLEDWPGKSENRPCSSGKIL